MKYLVLITFLFGISLLVTSCKKEETNTNKDQTIKVVITEQNSNNFGIYKGDTIDWELEVNYSNEEDWEYESKLILSNGLDTTFTFPHSPKIIDFNFQAGKDNISNQDWHMESIYNEDKSHTIYAFDTISVQ